MNLGCDCNCTVTPLVEDFVSFSIFNLFIIPSVGSLPAKSPFSQPAGFNG